MLWCVMVSAWDRGRAIQIYEDSLYSCFLWLMIIGKDEKPCRRVGSYVTSRPERFGYYSEKYSNLVMFIFMG